MIVELTVNGDRHEIDVEPGLTLLEVLREELLLIGTKEGCGIGECGTCIVLRDGEPVTSCLVLVGDAAGRVIETVEGLAREGELSRLQRAFIEAGAFQCGFCTPGMLMSATALLREDEHPGQEEIKRALAGILCRCGAYPKILEAVTSITRGES